jgi:hypothetical protein
MRIRRALARGLLATAAVLVASVTVSSQGQVLTGQPPLAPPVVAPASPQVVRRTVQADGTIELTLADGSKRRIPGAALAATTPPSAAAASPAQPAPDTGLSPVPPPDWLTDADTRQKFLVAMRDYYAYRSSGLQHRMRTFEWQLFSSKVIFIVVLGLVACGIVFAAVQFRAGLRRKKGDDRDKATELDISTQGLKVSSPVLGVIILVISLAFFYLYLVYVYPISEIV